jgi:hypothetical protein
MLTWAEVKMMNRLFITRWHAPLVLYVTVFLVGLLWACSGGENNDPVPTCGDTNCDANEDCASCADDCGSCTNGIFNHTSTTKTYNEGDTQARFTVLRENDSAGTASVRAASRDGTATAAAGDYQHFDIVIEFAAGETSISTYLVLALDIDGDKVFYIDLSDPTNGTSLGAIPTATVTIIDANSSGSNGGWGQCDAGPSTCGLDGCCPEQCVIESDPDCGSGTTYFISNSGDDDNNGLSPALPWRTIGKINSSSFNDGDAVLFRRGDTFFDATLRNPGADDFLIGDYGSGLKPHFDGDQVMPINIEAESQPISNLTVRNLDISGQDWYQGKSSNLRLDMVNGVVIDGITGDGHHNGTSPENMGKTAITVYECTGYIEIKNCELSNWGPANLPVVNGTDIMGIGLLRHTNGSYDVHDNVVYNVQADCLQLYQQAVPGLVHHNRFYNCGENSIDIKATSNVEVFKNDFYRTPGFIGAGGSAGNTCPLIVHHSIDGTDAEGVEIHHNKFRDGNTCRSLAMTAHSGLVLRAPEIHHNCFQNIAVLRIGTRVFDTWVHHNLVLDPKTYGSENEIDMGGLYENNIGTGTRITNNTIVNQDGSCLHAIGIGCSAGSLIEKNVVYQDSSDSIAYPFYASTCGTAPQVQNNCWFNAGSELRAQFQGAPFTAADEGEWNAAHGGHFSDPQFTDMAANDFSLGAGTPCQSADESWGALAAGDTSPCEMVVGPR